MSEPTGVPDWGPEYFGQVYARAYAGPLYDELGTEEEVAFLAGVMAPVADRGPILDVGCGFGRHSRPLIASGLAVVGLDRFGHLLARQPKRTRRVVQADMREIPLRTGSCAGVYCLFNTFGYFGDGDNAAALREMARVLMPGGALVIQVPNRSVMARIVRETAPSETLGPGYAGTEAYEYDPETNRMHGAGAWQVGGETQFWNFSLRLYTLAELKKLAAKEGLSVTGTFEDYLGEPFDARTSSEMIVVFKRRD